MTDMRGRDDPIYFGQDSALFGMYGNAPEGSAPAVLLCPPLGQEMIRTHRIYRQLARTLRERGHSVLRFDYRGSGDSSGDSIDLDWSECIKDLATAADELRSRSGQTRIAAFGARLGASVALCAAPSTGFERMALWDPVLDGREYVKRQDELQAMLPADPSRFVHPRPPSDATGQWLGFRVHDRLRKQLSELRIPAPEAPFLIVDSMPDGSDIDWSALTAAKHEVARITPATEWESMDRLEHAILLPDLVQVVADHLCAVA